MQTQAVENPSTRGQKFNLSYLVYWTIGVLLVGFLIGQQFGPSDPMVENHTARIEDHSDHLNHDHTMRHGIFEMAAADAPTVELRVVKDSASGWNLLLDVERFRFAPEAVNGSNQPGEGHGHIYVDGEKLTRLYGTAYHLSDLPPGTHDIMVTLNANNHDAFAIDGKVISASVEITQ